jgi:hypothetical protein
MVRVSSSAILSIGYNPQTGHKRIQFQQGHTYDFCRVPVNVHAAFMRSYSKGAYYNDHIKDRYAC